MVASSFYTTCPSDTLRSLWQSFPLPQTLFVRRRHKNDEVFKNHRLHLISPDAIPTLLGEGSVCDLPLNPDLCPPCWVFSLSVLHQAVQFLWTSNVGLHLSYFKAWYILYRHWRVPCVSAWNMRDVTKRVWPPESETKLLHADNVLWRWTAVSKCYII